MGMTVQEVEKLLREAGTELQPGSETPRGKNEHGKDTDVDFADLRGIAKTIRKDAVLADELYTSSTHEMKMIAAMIDDPESYTLDQLDERSKQLNPTEIGPMFCRRIMAKSPHAVHFINKWLDSEDESQRFLAYLTLEELTKKDAGLSSGFYRAHLTHMAEEIETETPTVRNAMASAAESIFKRVGDLGKTGEKNMGRIRRTKG